MGPDSVFYYECVGPDGFSSYERLGQADCLSCKRLGQANCLISKRLGQAILFSSERLGFAILFSYLFPGPSHLVEFQLSRPGQTKTDSIRKTQTLINISRNMVPDHWDKGKQTL